MASPQPLIHIPNLKGREALLVDYFQHTFNTTINLTQEPTKATHTIKPSDIQGSKWRGIIIQLANIYGVTLPEDEDDLPVIYTFSKQMPPAFVLPIPIEKPIPLAFEYEYYLLPSMTSDVELNLLMEVLRTPRDKTSDITVVIDIEKFTITREWVDLVLANKFASVILVENLSIDFNNPTWRDELAKKLSTTNKLFIGNGNLPNEKELFESYYNPQVQQTTSIQETPTHQEPKIQVQQHPTPQHQDLNTSFGGKANKPTTSVQLDMTNCPYKLDNTYTSVPKEVLDKLNNPSELYAIMTGENSWVKDKLVPFFNFNIKNLIDAVHSIGCLEKLVSVEPTIPIDKETLVHNGISLLIWLFKLLKEDIQLDSLVTMFNSLSYESGSVDLDLDDSDNDSSTEVTITFQSNIDVELYTECKELYINPVGTKVPINITKTLFKDMDEDVLEIIDFSNFGIPNVEVELGFNSENVLGHYTYYINGNLADRGAINSIYNDVKNIVEELVSIYTGNLKSVNNRLLFENGIGQLFNQWVHSLPPTKELGEKLLYQNLPDNIKPEVLMGMNKHLSRLGRKISDKAIIDFLNENNIEHTINDDCTVTITKGLSVLKNKEKCINLYNYVIQNSIEKGFVKSLRDLVNGIYNLIYRNPYYLVKFVAQDLMGTSLDLMNMTVKGTSGEEYLKARVSSIAKYNERKSNSFKEVVSSKAVEPSPLPKSEEIVAVVLGQLLDDTGVSHHLPLFVLNRIVDNINNTSKCVLYPIITNEYDLSNSFREGLAVISSKEILPTEASEVKAYCIATLRNSPINSSTVTTRDFVSMEVSTYITNEGLATLRTKLIELKEAKR